MSKNSNIKAFSESVVLSNVIHSAGLKLSIEKPFNRLNRFLVKSPSAHFTKIIQSKNNKSLTNKLLLAAKNTNRSKSPTRTRHEICTRQVTRQKLSRNQNRINDSPERREELLM